MEFIEFLEQLKNEGNSHLIESVIKPAFVAIHESEDEEEITSEDIKEDIADTVEELEVKKEIVEKLEELETSNEV
jgi:hypothetical protein